jgi:transposase-like protein
MIGNIPGGSAPFKLSKSHRRQRRMATTNTVENLNKEIKQRTTVAPHFPNGAALPRLASAIMMATSENPEAGKRHVDMNDQ